MVDPSAIRVLVVARGWCWREAALRVLEQRGFSPSASEAGDALRRVEAESFDVAMVDLDDADGPETLAALRRQGIPCIAVSEGRGRSEVAAALGVSASYAVKSELDPERLSHLARAAASGDALFVQASRRALESLSEVEQDARERYALTSRELDVLRLLADGRTNVEIAQALHLAPSSVKKLVSRCLARLGVRNRVEAALLARREGLVAAAVRDR